jgi:hypothetical protein
VCFASTPRKITRSITPQEDELFPRLPLYYMYAKHRLDESMILSQHALGNQSSRGEEREKKGEKFI